MKSKFHVYLAGACYGLSMTQQNEWREYIKNRIESNCNDVFCTNPCDYFTYTEKKHLTELEVKKFDLNRVRNSNLIIVNFSHKANSIGTAMEIAIGEERRIPIIGLNLTDEYLHPWMLEACDRIFTDMDEMMQYVFDYYLDNI